MSSESELFESQSPELCNIIDLMPSQLGPSGKFLHKRGLFHFCEGILGKQMNKKAINTCRLNIFPDCNITFGAKTTGMTATSFTDEIRNEARWIVFCKGDLLKLRKSGRTESHLFPSTLVWSGFWKNPEEQYMNKTFEKPPLCSYIIYLMSLVCTNCALP